MTKTICITTPFENSGNTALAANLAAGFAVFERRCLLVDLDPAKNAICALRARPFPSSYPAPGEVNDEPSLIMQAVLPTDLDFLSCIPWDRMGIDLPENKQASTQESGRIIPGICQRLFSGFDVVVFHVPASVNVADLCRLFVFDQILIPVAFNRLVQEKARDTEKSLAFFINAFQQNALMKNFSPELLLTLCPDGLSETMKKGLAEISVPGLSLQKIRIPEDDAVSKAALFGEPVLVFDITAPASHAFLRLTAALIDKISVDSNHDDLAKSRFAPFYSTGEEISSPAIRNEFGWFHPYLRPALTRARPVDGLFTSPSIMKKQMLQTPFFLKSCRKRSFWMQNAI